ncbi:MAG: MFS transporter, partial [Veillonellaceae bacterium]|nr:MFS transporter [Veillonellaceae bacterium]
SKIPALSFDSHEREVTATVARIGSVFGGQMVTVIVMPVVLYFSVNQNGGAGDPTGWFAFACIGGGIATLGAIILAWVLTSRIMLSVKTRKKPLPRMY